jgi:hypothetical protein
MHKPHVMSGGRYPVLRSFAILYVLGAALTVLGGIVGIVYALVRAPFSIMDRVIISSGILVATCFAVLTMLAIAELLKLAIDIEHNTRMRAAGPVMREVAPAGTDGGGRLAALDEETAEAALLRGH